MGELAPFRLAPYFRTRVWGFNDLAPWYDHKSPGEPIGEVWLTGAMCTAATGPLAGQPLGDITARYGRELVGAGVGESPPDEFPLLIKLLFPKEKLSVQVHPDDAMARRYGAPHGKTECWYVLDARPEASVALGLRPGATTDGIRAGIRDATLEAMLEPVAVETGDMIYVDAGTVHAMGPGVVMLETQQMSDLTYRLYDYGRPRELHIEKAIEALRMKTRAGRVAPRTVDGRTVLIEERYFEIERWTLGTSGQSDIAAPDGRVRMLFVARGAIAISGGGESFSVDRSELAVVPASAHDVRVTAEDASTVLRIEPRGIQTRKRTSC